MNYIKTISICLLATFVTACGNTTKEQKSNFEKEKNKMISILKEQEDKLNNTIEEISEEIKVEGEKAEANAEKVIADLKLQKVKLKEEIDKLGDTTEDTWEDIEKEAQKISNDIDQAVQDIRKDVKDATK